MNGFGMVSASDHDWNLKKQIATLALIYVPPLVVLVAMWAAALWLASEGMADHAGGAAAGAIPACGVTFVGARIAAPMIVAGVGITRPPPGALGPGRDPSDEGMGEGA